MQVPDDAPKIIVGFLVSYEDNELGSFYVLRQGKNTVGRAEAAEGLDIEIDHPTTSSRHAVLHGSAKPGRVKIDDPGSTNGTFLNGERLANNTPTDLKDGDELRFGGYTTTVKIV